MNIIYFLDESVWSEEERQTHPQAKELELCYLIHIERDPVDSNFKTPTQEDDNLGIALFQKGDLIAKAIILDDLETICFRDKKRLGYRDPSWYYSEHFLNIMIDWCFAEINMPAIIIEGKPERVNHLVALRTIARISRPSDMATLIDLIQKEEQNGDFFTLLFHAIGQIVNPDIHRSYHHFLLPLFDKYCWSEDVDLQFIGEDGLHTFIVPESIPYIEKYFREAPIHWSGEGLMDCCLSTTNKDLQKYFINFIPKFLLRLQAYCLNDDYRSYVEKNNYQYIYDIYHQNQNVTLLLYEKFDKQSIVLLEEILYLAKRHNLPELYDLAKKALLDPKVHENITIFLKDSDNNFLYEKFIKCIFDFANIFQLPEIYNITINHLKNPQINDELKYVYFNLDVINDSIFPYFREEIYGFLHEKHKKQKEMAMPYQSISEKNRNTQLYLFEIKINQVEEFLNNFEPTPITDFNKGLPDRILQNGTKIFD